MARQSRATRSKDDPHAAPPLPASNVTPLHRDKRSGVIRDPIVGEAAALDVAEADAAVVVDVVSEPDAEDEADADALPRGRPAWTRPASTTPTQSSPLSA